MMKNVVISGSGLFTPEQIITNEELVASYNQYVDLFNAEHADAIVRGEVTAATNVILHNTAVCGGTNNSAELRRPRRQHTQLGVCARAATPLPCHAAPV